MKREVVSIYLLRKLISYDPESGILIWKERPAGYFKSAKICDEWNAKHANMPCGYDNGAGYIVLGIFGRPYRSHRIAWALHYGEWPKSDIDHINGKRSDNRIINLRDVTRSENMRNGTRPSNNTSGQVGVHFDNYASKWCAHIWVDGAAKHLGLFANKELAIEARLAAQKKYGFHENHGKEPVS